MKVKNMTSNKGNKIANQFIIYDDNSNKYFQSYKSIIAKIVNNKIYLDKNFWDYSVTTGKYRNIFLNETKKETEKKIKSGEYILTNLNRMKGGFKHNIFNFYFSTLCGKYFIDENIALENQNIIKQIAAKENLKIKLQKIEKILLEEF